MKILAQKFSYTYILIINCKLVIFLLEKRPFKEMSIKLNEPKKCETPIIKHRKIIASPSMTKKNSIFSPSLYINKNMQKPPISSTILLPSKILEKTKKDKGKDFLEMFGRKKEGPIVVNNKNDKDEEKDIKDIFERRIPNKRKKNLQEEKLLNISEQSPQLKIIKDLKNGVSDVVEYHVRTEENQSQTTNHSNLDTEKSVVLSKSSYLCKLSKGNTKELWFQLMDKDLYCNFYTKL